MNHDDDIRDAIVVSVPYLFELRCRPQFQAIANSAAKLLRASGHMVYVSKSRRLAVKKKKGR